MTDDEHAELANLQREAAFVNAAVESVMRLERHYDRPTAVNGEYRLGWLFTFRGKLPPELSEMRLRADAYEKLRMLRARLWTLPHLNEIRGGVLLHAALALGVERLLSNAPLWAALQAEKYETAEHLLLRSNWAALAGDDEIAQTRILTLAREMRTGERMPA